MAKKTKTNTPKTQKAPKVVMPEPSVENQKPLIFPEDVKVVATINFNTPELTEAAILSLRKHGGKEYKVVVFDNSCECDFPAGQGLPARHFDARPFTKQMENVTVIDNTHGQVLDFQKLLAEYQDRNPLHSECNDWGSTKHIWTVQKLWELIPNGFVLFESDCLLKQNIDFMFNRDEGVIGHVCQHQPGNRFGVGRLMPLLCWMNVPMLTKCGARYFDPERSWMLWPGEDDIRNWYDTGACLLEDVRSHMNGLCGKAIDIRPLIVHKQAGSWQSSVSASKWLELNAALWK